MGGEGEGGFAVSVAWVFLTKKRGGRENKVKTHAAEVSDKKIKPFCVFQEGLFKCLCPMEKKGKPQWKKKGLFVREASKAWQPSGKTSD